MGDKTAEKMGGKMGGKMGEKMREKIERKLRGREEAPFLEYRDESTFIDYSLYISVGMVEVVTHLRSLAGRGVFSGPS